VIQRDNDNAFSYILTTGNDPSGKAPMKHYRIAIGVVIFSLFSLISIVCKEGLPHTAQAAQEHNSAQSLALIPQAADLSAVKLNLSPCWF
jgi:hypothetical protein